MTDNADAIRAEIHAKAAARSEATVYSMQNTYLTVPQKAQIEGIYQFPSCVMDYGFIVFAVVLGYPFWHAWALATGASVVGWIAARFLPGKLIYPLGMVLGGWTSTIACLIAAVWAATHHHTGAALYLVVAAFGITSFVEIVTWLWTISSRRMNAKYEIAKREWGTVFPFESQLD